MYVSTAEIGSFGGGGKRTDSHGWDSSTAMNRPGFGTIERVEGERCETCSHCKVDEYRYNTINILCLETSATDRAH